MHDEHETRQVGRQVDERRRTGTKITCRQRSAGLNLVRCQKEDSVRGAYPLRFQSALPLSVHAQAQFRGRLHGYEASAKACAGFNTATTARARPPTQQEQRARRKRHLPARANTQPVQRARVRRGQHLSATPPARRVETFVALATTLYVQGVLRASICQRVTTQQLQGILMPRDQATGERQAQPEAHFRDGNALHYIGGFHLSNGEL
jgi:hypothetical protein